MSARKKARSTKIRPAGLRAGMLLGMGNPLLDICANVDMAFLDRYGLSLNNAILAEEKHIPMYKELVDNFSVEYVAGGATQNSIRAAQWLSGCPGFGTYIGCIGNDAFGQQLKAAAEKDGLTTLYLHDAEHPTGTCAVLVHDNERSLVANLSAANHYKTEHLNRPEVKQALENASLIYSAGFFLTVSPDSMVAAGKLAKERNKVYAMNLSAPFLPLAFRDAMLRVLPYCDIVFGNESEAAAFAEASGMKGASVPQIAMHIASLPKENGARGRLVVITQGMHPTLVAWEGKTTEYPVEPLAKEKIVDTNGAGDAFVGGFLVEYLAGRGIEECVQAGHWAARVVIQHSGCTYPDECTYWRR